MLAHEELQNFKAAIDDCRKLREISPNKIIYKKAYQKLISYSSSNNKNSTSTAQFELLENEEQIDFITKPPHMRSKTPLRSIKITEIEDLNNKKIDTITSNTATKTLFNHDDDAIPDHIVDKIFNNSTGESQHSSQFSNRYSMKEQPSTSSLNSTMQTKKLNKAASESEKIKNEKNLKISLTEDEENSKLVVEKEENEKDIIVPDIPKSGLEFQKTWRELSNLRKYLYLKVNLFNLLFF